MHLKNDRKYHLFLYNSDFDWFQITHLLETEKEINITLKEIRTPKTHLNKYKNSYKYYLIADSTQDKTIKQMIKENQLKEL